MDHELFARQLTRELVSAMKIKHAETANKIDLHEKSTQLCSAAAAIVLARQEKAGIFTFEEVIPVINSHIVRDAKVPVKVKNQKIKELQGQYDELVYKKKKKLNDDDAY